MDIEHLISFFGWCAVINIGVLLYWAFFLMIIPDWTYRYTNRWLSVTQESFNTIHFQLIGVFKLGVILFNIVPYFALIIIS